MQKKSGKRTICNIKSITALLMEMYSFIADTISKYLQLEFSSHKKNGGIKWTVKFAIPISLQ